jgi:hypothetical protein
MAYNPLLQGITFSQQAQQQYQQAQNQAQGLNLSQLAQQAHNQFGSAYNAYAQQGMNQQLATQQYNAHIANLGRTTSTHRWMIDGKTMDFEEFVNTIYPDECAEKTYLILKFKKED